MKINFLEIAQIELDDAIGYYNYESAGLGDAFLTEVLNALDRIGEFPEAWHPGSKRTRRMSNSAISIRNYIPNTRTRNPGCGSRKSTQKA